MTSARIASCLLLLDGLLLAAAASGRVKVPAAAWAAAALVSILGALVCLLRRPRSEAAADDAAPSVEWPVALLQMNAGGRITQSNGAARELFDLGDGEAATLASLTHPDEAGQNERLLAAMLNGRARDEVRERRCFTRSGAHLLCRWHLRFSPAPSGGAQQAMILVEDITREHSLEYEAQRARQALHDLHAVIAGSSFEEQVPALLDLGRRRFGVETAILAQRHEGRLRLIEVRSDDERLRRASSYSLDNERHEGPLRRPQGPRGLVHAPFEAAEGEVPAPVFKHEGETYLGAPVVAEGQVWGGLHFSDAEGREAIEAGDSEFLEVMASWLGGEIERRQARASLEKQQRELLEAAVQLENLAVRDGLTGAKNRRAFDEAIANEWQRARRYRTPLSLILLDVDKFKSYNDTFGHPAGDEVLKKVAQVLGDSIRNIDFLARYGGEEFVILLPNTDADGAMILAERLRERIEFTQWSLRPVTSSFGVATITSEMTAPAALLQTADEALYHSKESGRNRVTHARVLAPKPPEVLAG